MATPLLVTKLSMPPLRRELVPRAHLLDRLNDNLQGEAGFARKLTLVSAPPGYGKTTLVVDWLGNTGLPVAWFALDENDNDPARFLAYLIYTLSQISTEISESLQPLLESPQPPPAEAILTALVNQIARLPSSFALALDDYHVIQTPAIHQQLNFLLEYQPANLHLVVITREDPPVPVSRLRARGEMVEIRQPDLSFTRQETAEFIRRATGLDLSEGDVQALSRRTEGWVAGLLLASLSIQGAHDVKHFVQEFARSNRYILDYLFEEVFDKQPVDVQDFLLKTAVLERFCASLCQAVTGREDSASLLEELENHNLFVAHLDPGNEWYRFHRLFSELLRHRSQLTADIQEKSLHDKASRWFEANSHMEEAVRHALASQDWEHVSQLIYQTSGLMLKRGEVVTLLNWLNRIPMDEVLARPMLSLEFSWPLVLAGQLDAAERLAVHAEGKIGQDPHVLGQVAAIQAYIARSRGDNQRTVAMSQRALSLLPESQQELREILGVNLGIDHWHNGQLSEAEAVLTEARQLSMSLGNRYAEITAQVMLNRIQAARVHIKNAHPVYQSIIETGGHIPILSLAYMDLGAIHYEWNELESCEEYLKKSIRISEQAKIGEFQVSGHMQFARLRLARDDIPGAIKALRTAESLLQDYSVMPLTRARIASLHLQLALLQGDLRAAQIWAERAGESADVHTFYPFLGLSPARLLLAQNRKAAALSFLDERFESASKADWGYGLVEVRVLQALAAATIDEAHQYLQDALHRGEPEGFIRTFADAGQALVPLLQEAARRGTAPDYVGEILAAMVVRTRSGDTAPLVEALSEREMEVLRLLVAGLSNREIAGKLYISLGTVKTHIHNIYGKLDARNRAQAIARAREKHLV